MTINIHKYKNPALSLPWIKLLQIHIYLLLCHGDINPAEWWDEAITLPGHGALSWEQPGRCWLFTHSPSQEAAPGIFSKHQIHTKLLDFKLELDLYVHSALQSISATRAAGLLLGHGFLLGGAAHPGLEGTFPANQGVTCLTWTNSSLFSNIIPTASSLISAGEQSHLLTQTRLPPGKRMWFFLW